MQSMLLCCNTLFRSALPPPGDRDHANDAFVLQSVAASSDPELALRPLPGTPVQADRDGGLAGLTSATLSL